jgi:hypothetical protein
MHDAKPCPYGLPREGSALPRAEPGGMSRAERAWRQDVPLSSLTHSPTHGGKGQGKRDRYIFGRRQPKMYLSLFSAGAFKEGVQ